MTSIRTRGDLARSASAPHAGDAEPRYPGTCRDRYTSRGGDADMTTRLKAMGAE